MAIALVAASPVAAAVRSAQVEVALAAVLAAESPIPFRAFAVRWEPDARDPSDPGFAARFARDDATWTAWAPLRPDPDGDPGAATRDSALFFLDEAHQRVELALAEPDRVEGGRLVLVFIDPGETPAVAVPRAAPLAEWPPRPPFVSRVGWGCPDGAASPAWPPQPTEPTHLVVHHTATPNDASDWPAQVRSIWAFHTDVRGWGDIGYNWLIDPLGAIYEGRSGGDDVIGAHFSCRNSNTMGVALLGSFEGAEPTPAAFASLEALLAFTSERRELDPLGAALHPGMDLVLPTILGHRDGNPSPNACSTTVCPGDALYALLPDVRANVAEALDAPEPSGVLAAIAALLALAMRAAIFGRARAPRPPRARARCRPAPARSP